jgi:hypothetical protein
MLLVFSLFLCCFSLNHILFVFVLHISANHSNFSGIAHIFKFLDRKNWKHSDFPREEKNEKSGKKNAIFRRKEGRFAEEKKV